MKKRFAFSILLSILFIQPAGLLTGYAQENENVDVSQSTPATDKNDEFDIFLVLDNSGSMKENDPGLLTCQVVTNFVNGLGEKSRLGMIIFDRQATLARPLTQLTTETAKENLLLGLKQIDYKGLRTNSPDGIERAIYELKNNGRKGIPKIIIFLTDGIVDTGNKQQDIEKLKWLKEDLAQDCQKSSIQIYGIAFTDNADFSLIQTLANKTNGQYYRAYRAEDIQAVFLKIKESIQQLSMKKSSASPQSYGVQVTEAPVPVKKDTEETGISLIHIIGFIIIILSLLILFFVIRKRQAKSREGKRPVDKKEPFPQAKLKDDKNLVFKESVEINKSITRIGRTSDNDIPIPLDTISATHAIIKYENSHFYIEDQRSSNGTFINGVKIESYKNVRLKSGDRITFDIYHFSFLMPDQMPIGQTQFNPDAEIQWNTEKQAANKQSPKPAPSIKEEPAKEKSRAGNELLTKAKNEYCANHPSKKATELCSICQSAFCPQCVSEKEGKIICHECQKK